jgi:peptide/nickel transport system permease protein
MATMTSQGPRSGYQQRSFVRKLAGLTSQMLKTRGAGPGLAVVLLVLLLAVAADLIAPYNPNVPQGSVLTAPNGAFWLGTDHLGRDVLSRIIFGSRVAVEAGIVSVGFAILVGVTIGLLAGYWGGWVDDVLMRLVDAIWSFPTLVLALAIAFSLGQGLINAMIAIGVVFTPAFARLVRGQALSVRERDFVTAARVLGAGPTRIMLQHIWPNVVGAIIVQSSLMVAQAIIVEAALSFLGLGVEPPQASWGSMLRTGYQYMERAPYLSFFPGLAIFITVLSLNLLGDGLRLALDPRLRERGSA